MFRRPPVPPPELRPPLRLVRAWLLPWRHCGQPPVPDSPPALSTTVATPAAVVVATTPTILPVSLTQLWPPPPTELPPPRLRSRRSRLPPRRGLVERLPSRASFGVGQGAGSGPLSWATLKALTIARVGARLICPKEDVLSRRAQTSPTEKSPSLNDDRRSHFRRAVAAATTASAGCAENSTLGVIAMY